MYGRKVVAFVTVVVILVVGGVVTGVSNLKEAVFPSKFVQPTDEVVAAVMDQIRSSCYQYYLDERGEFFIAYGVIANEEEISTAVDTVVANVWYDDWIPDEENPEKRQSQNIYYDELLLAEVTYDTNLVDMSRGGVRLLVHPESAWRAIERVLGI